MRQGKNFPYGARNICRRRATVRAHCARRAHSPVANCNCIAPFTGAHRPDMFDTLISTAQRSRSHRAIRGLMSDCRRLLSERGQANSVAIASELVAQFATLDGFEQRLFFDRLAQELSPDPSAVLSRA